MYYTVQAVNRGVAMAFDRLEKQVSIHLIERVLFLYSALVSNSSHYPAGSSSLNFDISLLNTATP